MTNAFELKRTITATMYLNYRINQKKKEHNEVEKLEYEVMANIAQQLSTDAELTVSEIITRVRQETHRLPTDSLLPSLLDSKLYTKIPLVEEKTWLERKYIDDTEAEKWTSFKYYKEGYLLGNESPPEEAKCTEQNKYSFPLDTQHLRSALTALARDKEREEASHKKAEQEITKQLNKLRNCVRKGRCYFW